MINYKEKIKKLIALSESSNEYEAKAALLKAKELMAEYKIAEVDLVDAKNRRVKRVDTGCYYTKRGEFWISNLAQVIAENYCCKSANSVYKGAQKRQIVFIGLEDDVELCARIFEYAVDTARNLAKLYLKEKYKGYNLTVQDKNRLKNSYAYGFTIGVMKAFETQKRDETGWGLVMVVPKEVADECAGFRTDRYRSKSVVYGGAKHDGIEEGRRFNPNAKLESAV